MKGIVGTHESDVVKTIGSWSITFQSGITRSTCRYTTRIYFLFYTTNKRHVDISWLITLKDSATTSPMHLTFDSTAESQESIEAVAVIINPVTLTIKTHHLEVMDIKAMRMQMSVLTNTETAPKVTMMGGWLNMTFWNEKIYKEK